MSPSPFLSAALAAAHAGEAVIRRHYQGPLGVEYKADASPVTVADVETEQAIRAVLAEAFPEHGFYGEETGRSHPEAEYTWLVDPIDGTKSYIRQIPYFSTQIALLRGGERVLGVSNAPLAGELAWAERGGEARLNGLPLAVSGVDALAQATLSTGNIRSLALGPAWQGYARLVQQVDRCRGYGDFLHYHLLAAGKIDIVLESDVNILDVAALAVIVEAAGGRVTDLDGAPLTLSSTSILATNGRLHERVLGALHGASST